MTKEYREALTEVNEILKFCDINLVKKIPYKFKKFVEDNMSTDYKFEMNLNKPVNQQNISKRTKYILAMIYKDYLCTDEKKKKIENYQINIKKLKEEEMEKYNTSNLFENKKIVKNDEERCTELTIKSKETLGEKIRKFLKKIF